MSMNERGARTKMGTESRTEMQRLWKRYLREQSKKEEEEDCVGDY